MIYYDKKNSSFRDNETNKYYATPEFNGDKSEYDMFNMGDTCMKDWTHIAEYFMNVKSLNEFKEANKQAQKCYISNVVVEQEVLPIHEVENLHSISSDIIYMVTDYGLIQSFHNMESGF